MLEKKFFEKISGEAWNSKRLIDNFNFLTQEIGSRFAGTSSEKKAADFIKNEFFNGGLQNIGFQDFSFSGWKEGFSCLKLGEKEFPCIPLPFSPNGEFEGELVFLEEGVKENFEGKNLEGKIVMVTSATPVEYGRWVHRLEKYELAEKYGSKGFIFMNHYPGFLCTTGAARFGEFGSVPAVGISLEDGLNLVRLSKDKKVFLTVQAKKETLTSQNVIGIIHPDKIGEKRPIVIGGHYDTHSISPGASDNAVGICILIEIACILNKHKEYVKNPLVFVAFGSEEIGLIGSKTFLNEKSPGDIKLMINIDGIGTHPEFQFNTQGFSVLKDVLFQAAKELDLFIEFTNYPWPYSDHWPFVEKGIPSFQIRPRKTDRGRGWGHTSADTPDKISLFNLKSNCLVATNFVAYLSGIDGALKDGTTL